MLAGHLCHRGPLTFGFPLTSTGCLVSLVHSQVACGYSGIKTGSFDPYVPMEDVTGRWAGQFIASSAVALFLEASVGRVLNEEVSRRLGREDSSGLIGLGNSVTWLCNK